MTTVFTEAITSLVKQRGDSRQVAGVKKFGVTVDKRFDLLSFFHVPFYTDAVARHNYPACHQPPLPLSLLRAASRLR